MRFQRLRRLVLAAACLPFLLAACGGGETVVSKFSPTRLVSFGDAWSDVGQHGAQYTVNGNAANWTQLVGTLLNTPLAASSNGGTSYAVGNARVAATPDAAGNAGTPTIAAQIDAFLAAGGPQANDAILVEGGISDVIVQMQAELAGTQGAATTQANVAAAGHALGDQVRRLVNAGAKHVVVTGMYNLGRTPWSTAIGRNAELEDLTTRFNNALLVSIVDLGSTTLYIDTALFFNLITANPAAYAFTDVTSVLCTSVDPGPGIGIGANQVNSALCTTSTMTPGLTPAATLYADAVYMTPAAHSQMGAMVADRLRNRF